MGNGPGAFLTGRGYRLQAGFFGKLFLLASGASRANSCSFFAALNMVLSLYYYLKLVKTIFADPGEQVVGAVRYRCPPALAWSSNSCNIDARFMSWVYEYIREAV